MNKFSRQKHKRVFYSLCLCAFAFLLSGCPRSENAPAAKSDRVVLYCSVDDVYARPLIAELEKKTGLEIDPLFDTEAAKTAGLANRIRAEKSRPQGDVFWSSALLQTLLLSREGLLEPYISPNAKDIPAAFKAEDGMWTGLGARARVVVWSGNPFVGFAPEVANLASPVRGDRKYPIGISNPQFGTGSDWVAALTTRWGKEKTLGYFRALKQNKVRILPGNSVVAEKVARGELTSGVTDTDDYYAQKPKTAKTFNMEINDPNLVIVPGCVAILKNSPRLENARKLVDALLSIENEKRLVEVMEGVAPLRETIKPQLPQMRALSQRAQKAPVDTEKWPAAWDEIREPLADLLLKN